MPARVVAVFDHELKSFLEGGCALIVATVDADGAPHATRGWGLSLIDGGPSARLLVSATDDRARADLAPGRPVAVTGADVPTLRSAQCKGRVVVVDPATSADVERAGRFVDAFFEDIVATDGTPREVLERIVPPGFVAVTVTFDEVFDQTPGPRAGTAVGSR